MASLGIDIFQFETLAAFLRGVLEASPKLSLRQFARKLRFGSPSHLSMIMNGKKSLSTQRSIEVAEILKLSPLQQRYFLELASRSKATSSRLGQIRASLKRKILADDQFALISEWQHAMIYELVNHKDFEPTHAFFAQHSLIPISEKCFRESLERLFKMGLLQIRDGKIEASSSELVSTTDGIDRSAIKAFHAQQLRIAAHFLYKIPADQRDFSGVTLAFEHKELAAALAFVQEFQSQFNHRFSSRSADTVFQLNTQFFPLTKTPREKA